MRPTGVTVPGALAESLGRVLQNTLWDVRRGATAPDPVHRAIAQALSVRRR